MWGGGGGGAHRDSWENIMKLGWIGFCEEILTKADERCGRAGIIRQLIPYFGRYIRRTKSNYYFFFVD